MNTVLTMLLAFLVVLSPLLGAAAVVRVTRWIGTRPGRHRRRRSWPGPRPGPGHGPPDARGRR